MYCLDPFVVVNHNPLVQKRSLDVKGANFLELALDFGEDTLELAVKTALEVVLFYFFVENSLQTFDVGSLLVAKRIFSFRSQAPEV